MLAAILVQAGQAAPAHLGPLPVAVSKRMVASDCRRLRPSDTQAVQDGITAVIALGPQLPMQHQAVFQPLVETTVHVFGAGVLLSLPKDSKPAVSVASAARPPGNSGTGEPCFWQRPGHRQPAGWTGPPLSSRRPISLVPPSIKCEQLHEDFVNDALSFRWVNSIPAFLLSCPSAVTGERGPGTGHRPPFAEVRK